MSSSPELVQIITTVDSRTKAEELLEEIVGGRMAACGQILGPIKSTYWWKGKLESAEEWLLIFKTLKSVARKTSLEIKRIHPYETPEIIVVGAQWVDEDYLNWALNVLNVGSEK